MRELTRVYKEKTKNIYQLTKEEFKKGEWCKEIPDSDYIELEYKSKNGILVVRDTPTLDVKKLDKKD